MSLGTCKALSREDKESIFASARNAAYTIIAGKQATYYAIGSGCAHLVKSIIHNKRTVLPVSHLMEGEYGIENICLSMPRVVGREGVVGSLCLDLTQEEQKKLRQSSKVLQDVIKEIGM